MDTRRREATFVTSIDLYVNFVLHAILGRLAEADTLMRLAGPQIRTVADNLSRARLIETKPLYRGLLLDPDLPFMTDPKLTFLSWSEDRDVAVWFACPRSVVSEPLMQQNPKLRYALHRGCEQLQRRWIDPMDIFENHQNRLPCRQPNELSQ